MHTFKETFAACGLSLLFLVGQAGAQQPTPSLMVVQAANAPAAPAAAKTTNTTAAPASSSLQAAIKALQQAKAANDETLKKQEAMLQQLDELQKAAEQLKVFAKRG
jgi:hypothetical protein